MDGAAGPSRDQTPIKKELSPSPGDRLTMNIQRSEAALPAWQQDPVLLRVRKTEIYLAICAEATQVGAMIYFGHELGIRAGHPNGTNWLPQGQRLLVRLTAWLLSLKVISTLSTQGRSRLILHPGSVGAKCSSSP